MGKTKRKFHKKPDNQGFSLMELLVSIVILILIMIPLMNNFFHSARMNSEAEKMQDYSNKAADIAEDLKSQSLAAMPAPLYKRLYKQSDGSFSTVADASVADNHIYYGYETGTDYDYLITLSADRYQFNTGHGDLLNNYQMPEITVIDENVNGLFYSNIYKNISNNEILSYSGLVTMLKALTVKSDDEIAALSQCELAGILPPNNKSVDQLALDYFVAAGNAYAEQQFRANSAVYANYLQLLSAKQNGENVTVPAEPPQRSQDSFYANPDYCQPDKVSKWITRTTDIQINKVEASAGSYVTQISYYITYQCAWPVSIDCTQQTYQIVSKQYGTLVSNVYLFYKESLIQEKGDSSHPDHVKITNNNTGTESQDKVNFYLVKQKSDGAELQAPSVKIYSGNNLKNINFYTDMTDQIAAGDVTLSAINNTVIAVSAPEDRVYSVGIAIYKYRETASEKYREADKLYTLDSIISKE